MSLLAIGLWIITRDGDYAIGLSLVADASAAFPTVVKAFKEPSSESAIAYLVFLIGAVTVLLATRHWTTANVAFPLYAATLYSVLCVLIVTQRTSRAKSAMLDCRQRESVGASTRQRPERCHIQSRHASLTVRQRQLLQR